MKLNPIPFSLAGSLTIGLGYVIIAGFIKYYPRITFRFIATTHLMPKLEMMRHLAKVTLPMVIVSTISLITISFIFLLTFCLIYNAFQK